ncbi:ATP-binding cassette domain-containing protein [Rugosimonospora africana]|uniref:Daunorubicin resistance protein DrrA family ABC transporter ATP-binding protein n=1 Tax=Rugosimonospora africana TaxID=556532 RepID=A0A8J3QV69_9ACTN|nr:ATP-binding cassette domain-containing protein [Rugosimonospora africana]GIH18090.1 daunorubicin resistance protein DrrA family ABC transporter ATP-binding protein [Rugosimonospora africana]
MDRTGSAIAAHGVHKRYRGGAEGAGLCGFDLRVEPGSVCGLLGPNGAGKTTAVRILSTLLAPDAGEVRVAGYDVLRQAAQVRRRIGLVGQSAAVDEILTGRQNLELFGRLHHLGAAQARRRADELLERFSLPRTGRTPVGSYSGGMRRRLDLAASLIAEPAVLFLDEPTTGLDPQGRQEVWASIRGLVATGTTVLLTTQYLEEADQLADRIAMLAHGGVVLEGTPEQVKSMVGDDRIDIVLNSDTELTWAVEAIGPLSAGQVEVDTADLRMSVPVVAKTQALMRIAGTLSERGIDPVDVTLRRPTLDEVFLRLDSAGWTTDAGRSEVIA